MTAAPGVTVLPGSAGNPVCRHLSLAGLCPQCIRDAVRAAERDEGPDDERLEPEPCPPPVIVGHTVRADVAPDGRMLLPPRPAFLSTEPLPSLRARVRALARIVECLPETASEESRAAWRRELDEADAELLLRAPVVCAMAGEP